MAEFGKVLISSGDIDPVYPVLKHIYQSRGWDLKGDEALWQTALYLASYKLTVGLAIYRNRPWPKDTEAFLRKFPTATERRGLRGPEKMWKHVQSLFANVNRQTGSISQWITNGWGRCPLANYDVFYERCQEIWGNGRWAAFKWCELLKKVHGFPLEAPDMGLKNASGPREGLCMVFGLPSATPVDVLNRWAHALRVQLGQLGLEVDDWETLETVLCNYHSHALGKYNVGHDIEEMYVDILKSPFLHSADHVALFEARSAVFHPKYLRECRGN
jgi:hypothetical protein